MAVKKLIAIFIVAYEGYPRTENEHQRFIYQALRRVPKPRRGFIPFNNVSLTELMFTSIDAASHRPE